MSATAITRPTTRHVLRARMGWELQDDPYGRRTAMTYECVALSTTMLPGAGPLAGGLLAMSWWAPEDSDWRPEHLMTPQPGELHVALNDQQAEERR